MEAVDAKEIAKDNYQLNEINTEQRDRITKASTEALSTNIRDGDDEDVGFEGTTHLVRVPRSQEAGTEDSTNAATVRINIEGMRCQSCVKNIEATVGGRPEVLKVRVLLEEKAGYIDYKPDQISASELVEAIEDMGFVASLDNGQTIAVDVEKSVQQTTEPSFNSCSVHIDGMTCMSCVKTITGVLSEIAGIKEVNVSLENKDATVVYDGNELTTEKIVESIEDMGFNAFAKELNGRVLATDTMLKNNNATNGDVPPVLQINGAGDVKVPSQLAKCYLHVAVNILHECRQEIYDRPIGSLLTLVPTAWLLTLSVQRN